MLPQGPYSPKETEKEILDFWLLNNYYKPEYNPELDKIQTTEEMKKDSRPAWALICPPPNAYARPHIGNISGYAYQDAMARYQRMQGKKVLVLPGKDHAGLEGEGVFVREVLEKSNRKKFDMKREDFYAEIMEFFKKNMDIARKDEKAIGLSADFDRDTFTLDPDVVQTVLSTFVEMYKKGMIYKGVRIVNWDPKARTAVADNQTLYEDAVTPFYYFKYTIPAIQRKTWELSFYNSDILQNIIDGKKTFETRALNPEEPEKYYGDIKAGDIIICVDRNTGDKHTFIAESAESSKDYTTLLKQNLSDILSFLPKNELPDTPEKLVEKYNTLAPNYGAKLKQNGYVMIKLGKYNGDADPKALELRDKFKGKGTLWRVQKSDEKKSYLEGERHDGTKIIGIAYDKVPVGIELAGEVIGIQMRLDGDYHLVVRGNDFEGDIHSEIKKASEDMFKETAGAHIILFADYPEDKYYTNGFIIGTVRPETIFADTAIACDPKDERYKNFIGKRVEVEFLGERKQINFISDYSVDKDFGTGLLKITPAHSIEDWEIASRHPEECLPAVQVIGYDLKLNHLAGKYEGMNIKAAREAVREDMKLHGNLVLVDDHYQNRIKIAERTKAPIEPLLSSQWYLKYDKELEDGKSIKQAATEMVDNSTHLNPPSKEENSPLERGERGVDGTNNQVTIHPESMVQKFDHWMENLRDWAISRSLWWGYRLPVWYAGPVKEVIDENGQVRELIKLNEKLKIKNEKLNEENQEGERFLKVESKSIPLSKRGEDNGEVVVRVGKFSDAEVMHKIDVEGWYQNFIDEKRGITLEKLKKEYGKKLDDREKVEEFKKMLTDDNQIFYVAESEGEVVGWVNLENIKLKTPAINWLNIYVAKDWQGKGIGSMLMEKVIEEFGNLEIHIATPENANLTGFYKKFGFAEYPVEGRKEGGLYMLQMKREKGQSAPNTTHPLVPSREGMNSDSSEERGVLSDSVTSNEGWVPLEYDNPNHLRVQIHNPSSVVIDVVRHGESVDNANKVFSGRTNCELTELGKQQAAEFTSDVKYDLIITSTLKRAMQTGEIIAKAINYTGEILHDELIVEKSFGDAEGMDKQEAFKKYAPEGYEEFFENPDRYNGETQKEVEQRIMQFVEKLKQNYSGKRILVVCHGGLRVEIDRILSTDHKVDLPNTNLAKETYEIKLDNPRTTCIAGRQANNEQPTTTWHQDENVLDTWFSSGQWVYATLQKYNLMDTFFPTDVLVSAHDILENWDSRMMMFTYFKHKNIPFRDLYLTGLVLGTDGQKMSKSKGNMIDMDKVVAEFGTDSVRMSYFYQNSAGGHYAITPDKLKNFKQFNNKIWNASRFVLSNLEGAVTLPRLPGDSSLPFTKKLLEHIQSVKENVTRNINQFEFGYATDTLYQEFWHTFCDILIEESKPFIYEQKNKETGEIISTPKPEEKAEVMSAMVFVLKEYLKMLHPFIPFITEKIWQEVPKTEKDHKVLMYSRW